MKQVLYIAYFFPPLGGAGVQRSLKFVRYLPEHGWQPTVLTGAADYWLRDDGLLDELGPSIVIHRVPAWGRRFLGAGARPAAGAAVPRPAGSAAPTPAAPRSSARIGLFRTLARWIFVPDAYLGWTYPARRFARGLAQGSRFDAVITTSSPDSAHLIGRALKTSFGIPWIADFRDPWVRRLSYAAPTPLHDRWQRTLEARCIEAADAVIVTSERTRADFLHRLPATAAEKITVVTNGYDEGDFEAARRLLERTPDSPTRWEAEILHAGQLNPDRPIGPFLAGLRRFLDNDEARPELRVLFLGGHYDRDVAEVRAHGLEDRVVFRGNVGHTESVAALLRARVLLLLENDSDRGELILPGKVFEYLRSGRPILAVVPPEGAAAQMVRSMDAGWIADPRRPETIAEGLDRLLAGPPAERPAADPPAGARVARFERRMLTRDLAQVLDTISPQWGVSPQGR